MFTSGGEFWEDFGRSALKLFENCVDCGEWGEKTIHRISPHFLQEFTAFLKNSSRLMR